ncbi:uncharacterized protein LY79DRAFT_322880 [Colletotrichum navitas]|uniref:Uncharacterized protein n=1 Tax=Colletotrichum navitas TaxID=681940 RepID=A0AAD8VA77_9PEZI|nr:uncharacterized protein LY79DRAFT_322880 [Colletotrichum navitas]KAK1597948.1 hypothetical protein LY79DRAFT_322880 [Colletotrichum navitas]
MSDSLVMIYCSRSKTAYAFWFLCLPLSPSLICLPLFSSPHVPSPPSRHASLLAARLVSFKTRTGKKKKKQEGISPIWEGGRAMPPRRRRLRSQAGFSLLFLS